ncbi:MAG: glycosyltransferase [Cyclobacteriaceae bacterium]|nr:glycosyltransferase [Cyclobacteriaceae bacterium]
MPAENPLISIVIPVKNGIHTLPDCLEGIRKQSLYPQCEIIAIDSGSSDGSLQYLQNQPGVMLQQITPESFNHGITRNIGVKFARGEFVVLTVQDASATNDQWISNMLVHFDDPNVAGVCGQQIVAHDTDKNPHQWFRPVNPPNSRKVHFQSPDEYEKLSPAEKKRACSWDNVTAMYRKSVLLKLPFRNAFFAEDAMWAQDALKAGYTLVYDTAARVYHYHYMSYNYTYQRILTQLYFSYKIFHFAPTLTQNVKQYLLIIYRNLKYKVSPKWIWHNYSIIWARRKAFKDFNNWLKKGENYLDQKFSETIQIPPQGNLSTRDKQTVLR